MRQFIFGYIHTVFAEISAHPEISAHQKQWFSKGGVHRTDELWWVIFQRGEYTKPRGFGICFYCFWKLSARGVYFDKNTVYFTFAYLGRGGRMWRGGLFGGVLALLQDHRLQLWIHVGPLKWMYCQLCVCYVQIFSVSKFMGCISHIAVSNLSKIALKLSRLTMTFELSANPISSSTQRKEMMGLVRKGPPLDLPCEWTH